MEATLAIVPRKKHEFTYTVEKPIEGFSNCVISQITISGEEAKNIFGAYCQWCNWQYLFPDLIVLDKDGNPFEDNAVLVKDARYQARLQKDPIFSLFEITSKDISEKSGIHSLSIRQISGTFFTEVFFIFEVENIPEGARFKQISNYTLPSNGYWGIGDTFTSLMGVDSNQLFVDIATKSHVKLQRLMHFPDSFVLDQQFAKGLKQNGRNFELSHTFGLPVKNCYLALSQVFNDCPLK